MECFIEHIAPSFKIETEKAKQTLFVQTTLSQYQDLLTVCATICSKIATPCRTFVLMYTYKCHVLKTYTTIKSETTLMMMMIKMMILMMMMMMMITNDKKVN